MRSTGWRLEWPGLASAPRATIDALRQREGGHDGQHHAVDDCNQDCFQTQATLIERERCREAHQQHHHKERAHAAPVARPGEWHPRSPLLSSLPAPHTMWAIACWGCGEV